MGAPKPPPNILEIIIAEMKKVFTGRRLETIIIIGLVLPVSVASVNTYITDFHEKQNLAQAYKTEILWLHANLNNTINGPNTEFIDLGNNEYEIGIQCPATGLYPDWGLFHKNSQEISKFDKELSDELYVYYFSILWAEENRLLVCNQGHELIDMGRKNETNTKTYQFLGREIPDYEKQMKNSAGLSYNLTPDLTNKLDKTINAKPFIIV
jgi:hypothetical protein